MSVLLRRFRLCLLTVVNLLAMAGQSYAIDIPRLSAPVVDEVRLLNTSEYNQLVNVLSKVHQHSDTQIAILIAENTRGESLEQFSIKVAEEWQLGSAQSDRGLLILVVPKERKIRIEVGQGLEGDITDALANRIITQIIAPGFRQGSYGESLLNAVFFVLTKTDPELLAQIDQDSQLNKSRLTSAPQGILFSLVWFFCLAIIVISMFLSPFLLPSARGVRRYHSGNWGGGSFGGGGFSGGGGGFSGGGASGGW